MGVRNHWIKQPLLRQRDIMRVLRAQYNGSAGFGLIVLLLR
jgi:hypothetical protein